MKIYLRALTRDDLSTTLKWNNKNEIRDNYSGHPFPVNREMEELWYDKILTSNFPVTVFGIEHIESSSLIGLFILKNISMLNRSGELAIYIGNFEYKGKGLSYEAMQQGLAFAFNKLGLNRIDLKVLKSNSAAIGLYKKCGFIEEGLLRKSVFKNGEFHDQLVMSLLYDEYYEQF